MENNNKMQGGDVAIVDVILQQAITTGASDIHIDPERGKLTARLRIDGILYALNDLENYSPDEVISKIKVMAQMDIMERRLPQDGHLEFSYLDKNYNFRVSSTPTIYGEAVVMRMLDREGIAVNLSDLGFTKEQMEVVQKIINSPYGIVIITGPTGSGKTTLLYSFLNYLNKPEKNILTLEDPVEYQMANVRQMQINEAIGWDFAKGMRAVVRQDPDVIMLGEIRDNETAGMAFQAALTGRLVISTFHTFDVPGIIIRLIEMGIPRSVIAHSFTGVLSCRLMRKVCQNCQVDYTPGQEDIKLLDLKTERPKLKKGKGCAMCHNSGYSGRLGIFEIVYFDTEIKVNVMQERPDVSLHDLLKAKISPTLRETAIARVLQGATTVEEMVRVIGI
jgi:type IV pilus assembly protein PilB